MYIVSKSGYDSDIKEEKMGKNTTISCRIGARIRGRFYDQFIPIIHINGRPRLEMGSAMSESSLWVWGLNNCIIIQYKDKVSI